MSNNEIINKDKNNSCLILNLWTCRNYGAILTSFGVQCLLEKLNYNAKIIKYFPKSVFKNCFNDSFTEKFSKKYLKTTSEITTMQDFISLNDNCDIFIAGSDQIWNPEIIHSHHENASEWIFLLDFVNTSSKKISYSASFGAQNFPDDKRLKCFYEYYLKQFDNISVREASGIEILKKEFNLDGKQLIDGAFHIPDSLLSDMTADYSTNEKYIGFYALPGTKYSKHHKKLLKNLSKKLNLPVKRLVFDYEMSVEDWLTFIKNSEFMVASSYHAIVFSIIFNRPFIQIRHENTQERFDSLYKILNIPNCSMDIKDSINDELILNAKAIPWKIVNDTIKKEVQKAEAWLKIALEMHPKDKNIYNHTNILNLENQNKIIQLSNSLKRIYLLKNKKKFQHKYIKYSILSYLTFGDRKKYYKNKLVQIKDKIINIKQTQAYENYSRILPY